MRIAENYFRQIQNDYSSFPGQFIISLQSADAPAGWVQRKIGDWFLASHGLPLHDICDRENNLIGICLGFPHGQDAPWAGIDEFYLRTQGKWLLILEEKTIYHDPSGSLSVVYSDRAIASSPTLLQPEPDWDIERISAVQFPEVDSWFPFGLTSRRGIRRLLPNHCFDLQTWKVKRHWPTSSTDLSRENDPLPLVENIVTNLRKAINDVPHPLTLSLTAGRDSRMLLACSRDRAIDIDFYTFDYGRSSVDVEVARRLAKRLHLSHRLLPVRTASNDELVAWLYRTGHSVSGPIWQIHKTLDAYYPQNVLLPGMAGEVGRAYYWRSKDQPTRPLEVDDVLSRCKLPRLEMFRAEARNYLDGLRHLDTFVVLDLIYIEQRLGCWASPSYLGNIRSKYEFTPFSQRRIFTDMMKLPTEYRRHQKLAKDVCRMAWPGLETIPFNECSGGRWLLQRLKSRAKQTIKYLIGKY